MAKAKVKGREIRRSEQRHDDSSQGRIIGMSMDSGAGACGVFLILVIRVGRTS